jgi:hypothetical protein
MAREWENEKRRHTALKRLEIEEKLSKKNGEK